MKGKLVWLGLTAVFGILGVSCVAPLTDSEADDEDTAQAAQAAGGNSKNVTLCHYPPGNVGNAHSIVVAPAAVDTHLDHGDSIGPCGDNAGGTGGSTGTGTETGTGGSTGTTTNTDTGTGGSTGTTTTGGLTIGGYCSTSSECLSGACQDGACVDAAACVTADSGSSCSPTNPCCGEAHCVGDVTQTFCMYATEISCVLPGAECDPFADACCWGLACGEDGTCQ